MHGHKYVREIQPSSDHTKVTLDSRSNQLFDEKLNNLKSIIYN